MSTVGGKNSPSLSQRESQDRMKCQFILLAFMKLN